MNARIRRITTVVEETRIEGGRPVTLEAWVAPRAAFQGTVLQPTFIAGLADSVTQRDVVLLQSGGLWSARARQALRPFQ